jgi:hypothetical protein
MFAGRKRAAAYDRETTRRAAAELLAGAADERAATV